MTARSFDLAEIAPTPWKNGGGTTREIACWPPGADLGAFDWRVSVADIGASGPFSAFPAVDRVITLLDGDGVGLHGPGVDHRLERPLMPFAFGGELAIDCTLLGGASRDFNVMTRRARLQACVRVLRAGAALAPAPHGLLLAWQGHWQVDGQVLAPGQGLWWAGAERAGARLATADAEAALIAVLWRPPA